MLKRGTLMSQYDEGQPCHQKTTMTDEPPPWALEAVSHVLQIADVTCHTYMVRFNWTLDLRAGRCGIHTCGGAAESRTRRGKTKDR